MTKPNVNTLCNPKTIFILTASKQSKSYSTMEKKSTLWVVVTWDNESTRLTSKRTWNTESAAKDNVRAWYFDTKEDENCEGAQIDDDGLFACARINGREESCEAFEAEI